MRTEGTVAEHLARSLPEFGVTHVFELVGGMITVLLDSLHQNPKLRVVSMHHEQGAGFAAEGFARNTGTPAVALATSGPGATNLLTAMGSCYFDSIPVVFITGQVNRAEMRLDGLGRQGGFQETDIVAMSRPITKWAKLVDDPQSFPADLAEAFRVATSGRPGPVLLDIPMDVQRASVAGGPGGPCSVPVPYPLTRLSTLAARTSSSAWGRPFPRRRGRWCWREAGFGQQVPFPCSGRRSQIGGFRSSPL